MANTDQYVDIYAPDWHALRWARVKLWHEGGQPTEFLLDPETRSARWPDGNPDETYSYEVTFADHSGQTIRRPAAQASGARLLILPPFAAQLSGRVWLSPYYIDLEGRLSITIRYEDEDNDYRRDAALTLGAGDIGEWEIPIIDPDLLTYRYYAIVSCGGQQGPAPEWIETDEPVLLFQPSGQMAEVQVVTLVSPVHTLVKIKLAYDGEHGEQRCELIAREPFGEPLRWRFFADSSSPEYRYQVTIFDDKAVPHEQPEASSSDQVLIVLDPDAPS